MHLRPLQAAPLEHRQHVLPVILLEIRLEVVRLQNLEQGCGVLIILLVGGNADDVGILLDSSGIGRLVRQDVLHVIAGLDRVVAVEHRKVNGIESARERSGLELLELQLVRILGIIELDEALVL